MTRTKRRDNENEDDKKDLLLIQGYDTGSKQFSTFTHGYNTFGFSQIFCVFHITFDLLCISPQRIRPE